MHHSRPVAVAALISFIFILSLSGCATPEHTNLLMFGTNSKIAVDVSYDSQLQKPNLTIGYTRQELVLLPLLANREKGKALATSSQQQALDLAREALDLQKKALCPGVDEQSRKAMIQSASDDMQLVKVIMGTIGQGGNEALYILTKSNEILRSSKINNDSRKKACGTACNSAKALASAIINQDGRDKCLPVAKTLMDDAFALKSSYEGCGEGEDEKKAIIEFADELIKYSGNYIADRPSGFLAAGQDISKGDFPYMYKGTNGAQNGDIDTYSVIASLNADIKAGASDAGVGIAQYIATGFAAREMAKQGGAKLVTIQPESKISEDDLINAQKRVAKNLNEIEQVANYIFDETTGKLQQAKFDSVLNKSGLTTDFQEYFKEILKKKGNTKYAFKNLFIPGEPDNFYPDADKFYNGYLEASKG